MECIHPVRRRVWNNDLKRFELVFTPCGLCKACRINYSMNWGIRIMCESRLYTDSVFITLTYDDEHLIVSEKTGLSTVYPPDLCLFMKRLRRKIEPDKVRFFGVGEYGEKGHRAHMHVIVFGLSPFDKRVFKGHIKSGNGYVVSCNCWDKGRVHVGYVSPSSANYVAGYSCKKIKGKGAREKYKELDIEPEFARMSLKPGIGFEYMDMYSDDLINHGFIIVKGKKCGLPRYFKDKLDIKHTEKYFERMEEQAKKFYEDFERMDLAKEIENVAYRLQEPAQREKNLDKKYSMKVRKL